MKWKVGHYLFLWAVLNLAQSFFTELFHDEAYYWVFSQHLSWGYKDHPPATPFFIWLGWQFFQNELGVRLLMVLSSTLTIWMAWKITQPKDTRLFFLVVFSILIVHIGGFMAAPDIPLLLFSTSFLFFFKKYLERDSWTTALLLAFCLTGMAYSKYHGAIVLLLVLAPNLGLLKRPSAWLIPLVTLLLYSPHLYWQWIHDFPSFQYHFQDRGEDKYHWTFITDYLAGQLAIWGPLVSIPLFIGAWRYRSKSDFDLTLKWLLFGILGFFFYQSFQQRTEANWTSVIFLPLVYLAVKELENSGKLRMWVTRLAWISVGLLLLLRVYMAWDFLPKGVNPRNEFHGWKEWARDISEVAGDKPAVFFNRFQKPVKYLFYAGKPGHCQTIDYDTGTQFDLIPESEESVQGRTVCLIQDDPAYFENMDSVMVLPRSGKTIGYRVVEDFRSYNRLRIQVDYDEGIPWRPGEVRDFEATLWNPTDKAVNWETAGPRAVQLYFITIQYEDVFLKEAALETLPFHELKPGERRSIPVRIKAPDMPGRYRFRLGFRVHSFEMGRNSRFYECITE